MTADILLITVNQHEDSELKIALNNNGFDGQKVQNENSLSHYIIYENVNEHRVILTQSEIGSFSSGSSYETVKNAISDYDPKIIICVGIAWGADENDQRIGDLLLSDQIQIGSNMKFMRDEILFRGPRIAMNNTSIKTLVESSKDIGVRFHRGVIISKEDLFDNKDYRDKAAKACSAIGGEMEATGALLAIHELSRSLSTYFDLVVVKSICDWGYNKNINKSIKESNQKIAAKKCS